MNEEFQQALRAGDLDAIHRCPKSDLHNHRWAGHLGCADRERLKVPRALARLPCALAGRLLGEFSTADCSRTSHIGIRTALVRLSWHFSHLRQDRA
jgi:hypothetical protein